MPANLGFLVKLLLLSESSMSFTVMTFNSTASRPSQVDADMQNLIQNMSRRGCDGCHFRGCFVLRSCGCVRRSERQSFVVTQFRGCGWVEARCSYTAPRIFANCRGKQLKCPSIASERLWHHFLP